MTTSVFSDCWHINCIFSIKFKEQAGDNSTDCHHQAISWLKISAKGHKCKCVFLFFASVCLPPAARVPLECFLYSREWLIFDSSIRSQRKDKRLRLSSHLHVFIVTLVLLYFWYIFLINWAVSLTTEYILGLLTCFPRWHLWDKLMKYFELADNGDICQFKTCCQGK